MTQQTKGKHQRISRQYVRSCRNNKTRSKKSGFTLIELSIVLVIIGLIVGVVLVGQDLIRVAQLQRQIGQIEEFKTAMMTFRVKYDCLPGDCNKANALGLGGNGNGDRSIYNINSLELLYLWQHLANAGLIAGTYSGAHDTSGTFYKHTADTNIPNSAIGRSGGIMYAKDTNTNFRMWPDHWFVVAKRDDATGIYRMPMFDALEASSMDTKIDDGLPRTGRFVTDIMNVAGCNSGNTFYTTSSYTCPIGFMFNMR